MSSTVSRQGINFDYIAMTMDMVPSGIQLRYYIYHAKEFSQRQFTDKVNPILVALNIDPDLGRILHKYWNFRKDLLPRFERTIQRQRKLYEDMYGPLMDTLDLGVVDESLRTGILSLRAASMLNNPFSVLEVEKHYKLPETGVLDSLISNWNGEYYSPLQCQAYDSANACFLKAVEYNDMETFHKLYSTMDEMQIIEAGLKAAETGNLELLKLIMENPAVNWESHDNKYWLLHATVATQRDNREILELVWSNPPPGGWNYREFYNQLFYERKPLNIENIKFIIEAPEANMNVISANIGRIAGQGWVELFEELMTALNPNIFSLRDSFDRAAINGHDEMVQFLRRYVTPDNSLIELLLLHASEIKDPEYQRFRYILSFPEVNRYRIESFLEYYLGDNVVYADPIYDIILESGKMNRQELGDAIQRIMKENDEASYMEHIYENDI